MTSSIKARIALPAFLLKRVAANRSRSNALSLCLRVSFIAKPLHTFARHAVGNAARLCLLGALLVVPVGLDLGETGLALKSGAAYASGNSNMNDGRDNSAGEGSNGDQGNGVDSNSASGSNGNPDNAPVNILDEAADNGPANIPDNASDDHSNDGPDGSGGPGEDNAANSSSGGANGENSEDSENDESHRGAMRPANLTEFLASLRNGSRIVNAQREGNNIEIEYSDGWQEQIKDGIYTLAGPNDNVVIRRPATKKDYLRLNSAF